MPKPITVADYELVADDFFDKYNFVAERLPENTRAEDVIKIMQNLAGLVAKKRAEEKTGTIGFVTNTEEKDAARDHVELEMELAQPMSQQEASGFRFDQTAAQRVRDELADETNELEQQITARYLYVPGKVYTPKRATRPRAT